MKSEIQIQEDISRIVTGIHGPILFDEQIFLTSIEIAQLVIALENQYQITLPDTVFIDNTFGDIKSITQVVIENTQNQ